MKITKTVISAILSLLVVLVIFTSAGTEVSAEEKEIIVSKTYDVNDTYSMELTISAGGSFYDGETKLQGGKEVVVYELPLGTDTTSYKEFSISPDAGYQLVGLSYMEPDIDPNKKIPLMDQIEDGKFSLPIKSTRMVLIATFEKIDDGTGGSGSGSGGSGSKPKPSGGSDTSGRPGGKPSSGTGSSGGTQTGTSSTTGTKTGDPSTAGWYLGIMLIAAAAMIMIAAKKRTDVYKEPD